jgi:hypothetical protein
MRNLAIITVGVMTVLLGTAALTYDRPDDSVDNLRSIMDGEVEFPRDYCLAKS